MTIAFGLVNPFRNISPISSKKCTRELEGIVYHPHSAPREYLTKIMLEFVISLAESGYVPSSLEAIGLIKTFTARYDVILQVQTSINSPNAFFRPGEDAIACPRIYGSLVAPTYIKQEGFLFNPIKRTYSIARFVPDENGQGATIIISVDADSRSFYAC